MNDSTHPPAHDDFAVNEATIASLRAQLLQRPVEFQVEDLPHIGPLRIDSVGEENVYFELPDGRRGFCKVD